MIIQGCRSTTVCDRRHRRPDARTRLHPKRNAACVLGMLGHTPKHNARGYRRYTFDGAQRVCGRSRWSGNLHLAVSLGIELRAASKTSSE